MIFYDAGRLGIMAKIPRISKMCPSYIQTLADHAFPVKAAKLWNLLPKRIRDVSELEAFKASLGSLLEKVPDKPPTVGYTASCRNSLIDWSIQSGGLLRV